jgi:hypothetical protein
VKLPVTTVPNLPTIETMQGRRFRRRKSNPDEDIVNSNMSDPRMQNLSSSSQPVQPQQRRTVADLSVGHMGSSSGVMDYVSMSSTGSGALPATTSTTIPETFVTQPPRPVKGLTGKISTLFRRESSRERDVQYFSGSDAVLSSHMGSPLSAAAVSPGGNSSRGDVSSAAITNSPSSPPRWNSSSQRRSHSADRAVPVTTPAIAVQSHRRTKSRTDPDHAPTSTQRQSQQPEYPISQPKQPKLNRQHSGGKRIFYSSHQDDDSDDSYESRASACSRGSRGSQSRRVRNSHNKRGGGGGTTNDTDDNTRSLAASTGEYSTSYTDASGSVTLIKRYRGFSTSIKSLFLDESLVCGAFGCFGLILSNRTEYLLQLRNERRGVASKSGARHSKRSMMPSRIIFTGLAFTLLLMFSTFIIWGFGKGDNVAQNYLNGYDYHEEDNAVARTDDDGNNGQVADDGANDDGNNNNAEDDDQNRRGLDQRLISLEWTGPQQQQHPPLGIFPLRDYKEYMWDPIRSFVRNEWYRDEAIYDNSNINPTRTRFRRDAEDDTDDANDASSSSSSSSANNGSDSGIVEYERDIASDIRVALFFSFLLFLGVLGRRRRMRTRFHLVRARAQEDHLYYASSDEAAARRVAFDDTREDQYEGACSHTLCGCYPVDEVDSTIDDENVQVTDSGIFRRKLKRHNEDIIARSLNCLMATCCGSLCRCWFQCLSICALAQEAREVRLLIPPRYQRIDYITHQPFHEYQEAVNDLRRGWLGKARRISGFLPHYNALSRLSRYILLLSIATVLAILATLLFNPRAAFSWQDAVILVATFLQSFLVLFVVHWIFHKSDLSLDAVIKLFAAGFLIAVPTAFFFEGLLINIFYLGIFVVYDTLASVMGESFSSWVDLHWRVIWMLGELVNAFIVAAVTEELCKYYSFRCVEHPDLVFLTGLQRDTQEEDAVDGGLVKYPFASHQVQELSRNQSFRDDGSVSEHSHRSNRSNRSRSQNRRSEMLIERTGTTDAEFDEDELDVRTRRQKAMAITTGMISVAVGLACAENFVYVFVMGGTVGDDPLEAWITLFFRSIFPVHALSAAMQSINMIRKFVEFDDQNGHRVGVGRIIFPAVMIHGSFDAVLMGINVYVVTATDNYKANNGGGDDAESSPYNAFVVNLAAWVSIIGIMIAGILWYYTENRKQRSRLKILEEQDKASQADQWINGKNSRDDEEDIL